MKYHFKIHSESAGYWAQCVELEGCQTQADSREELMENIQEVLKLFVLESIDLRHASSKLEIEKSAPDTVTVRVLSKN
jgi:predicted RNase H-like HicB family nuclease